MPPDPVGRLEVLRIVHRRLTKGFLENDWRTGIARRTATCLACSSRSHQASSLVERLARLGWTRIGSPGIFGERNTKALFRAAKGQVAGERKWAGYRVISHPLVSA